MHVTSSNDQPFFVQIDHGHRREHVDLLHSYKVIVGHVSEAFSASYICSSGVGHGNCRSCSITAR